MALCQVKIQTWVDGIENAEFVGVGARFGTTIVSKEKNANQTLLKLSDPLDCCTTPKNKVFFFFFHSIHSRHLNITMLIGKNAFVDINVCGTVILIVLGCWRCFNGGKRQLQIHNQDKCCRSCWCFSCTHYK